METKKELIKDMREFSVSLSKFHLKKPNLSIYFEDNFDDELKELWEKMDKAILEVIWKVNKTK
ncbi:hypothetical protein LCGC14_0791840 [marine sediment metagenome]|uniref:Uncharacterized protein n=1 Tax=marine sediment metagenome TaxID=412755 RepID=A0A0F9PWJ1_9ZZZZ|nr:hypothetical protein [archaeon]